MTTLRIKTSRFFDGERLHSDESITVTVRGNRITEVSGQTAPQGETADASEIDASSLTILPGLIDAHFHPVSASFDVASIDRSRVQSAAEVIRSATRVNAELVNMSGQIGTIAPGAFADIIGVAGDPVQDLRVLAEPETHLKLVIRGGEIVLNRLTESQS